MRLRPFVALRPPPQLAGEVAAVPYDTVDTEEARAIVAGHPKSFLRIGRPEVDLPPGADPHSDAAYLRAGETLKQFIEDGWLRREADASLYVYRLRMGAHIQHGVVGCCHIEDYEADVIRKHEKTRADKEDDRTRHIELTGAQTGPILMTFRDAGGTVARLIAEAMQSDSLCDFTASDGIRHTVWRMPDPGAVAAAFGRVDRAYIADGHHRAAAAARVGAARRAANPAHRGDEEYNGFTSVLFPSDQLQVLPYNRCVADLNGRTPEEFLSAVRAVFAVREAGGDRPAGPRRVCMYAGGRWLELSWADAGTDPVASLDVSVLQDRLLAPVLGIQDPRRDGRIDFVGGIRGTAELVRRVDAGRAAVAFSMCPVSVDQMMAIADAGGVMPPKSTWFEPKLRSGLFVHPL